MAEAELTAWRWFEHAEDDVCDACAVEYSDDRWDGAGGIVGFMEYLDATCGGEAHWERRVTIEGVTFCQVACNRHAMGLRESDGGEDVDIWLTLPAARR